MSQDRDKQLNILFYTWKSQRNDATTACLYRAITLKKVIVFPFFKIGNGGGGANKLSCYNFFLKYFNLLF